METLNDKELDVLNKIKTFVPTETQQYATFATNNSAVKSLVQKGIIVVQANGKNSLLLDAVLNPNYQQPAQQATVTTTAPVQSTTKKGAIMFEIENVSMPKHADVSYDYPLELMAVGQSFVLPYDHLEYSVEESTAALQGDAKLADAICRKARWRVNSCKKSKGLESYGFRFRVEERGVRVWLSTVTKAVKSEMTDATDPAEV